jgi:glycosyltransferase involved in cell wall biosynthesis
VRLRIGIDGTCWANDRGYGRFTRELVTALTEVSSDDQFVCFLDAESAERFELRSANLTKVIVEMSRAPSRAASHDGSRSVRDVLAMTRAVSGHTLDAFFYPSVYTWFPLFRRVPAVVTIYDAIPERFPELTLPTWRAQLFWRLKTRLALRQASGILTDSEFAANEIHAVMGVERERITVALAAPSPAFTPSDQPAEIAAIARRFGVPEGARWFVYVGGFNPHKNVSGIVRAHAQIASELGESAPYLLLVGTLDRDVFHGDRPSIERAISEAGTEALVKWTGFIPDAELRHINSGAIATLLPSDCEGFGLPAVEAAACGTPAIATTESPLPALLEGGGIFVPPRNHDALVTAMRLLATDTAYRDKLGVAALAKARELDWSNSARAAASAIHRVAA